MTPKIPTKRSAVACARSAAYGLVSNGFQYPDCRLVDTLRDPTRWSSWPQVLCGIDIELSRKLDAVRACLRSQLGTQAAASSEVDTSAIQETFVGLFGHAVRGQCPPYELEYGWSEIIQRASELADIAGFYTAFGLEITDAADDRADHIAVECAFMSVLCAKEAHALDINDANLLESCKHAQRDFLRDHLARWLPAFAHRVGQADPRGFYGALAGFTSAFVAGEVERFEIMLGPKLLELTPSDPVLDTAISCGSAEDDCGDAGDSLIQLNTDPTCGVKR